MRKIKVENLSSKIVLVFLILWGAASFFVFPTLPAFQWAFFFISLLCVYFAVSSRSAYFVLINITFSSSYFFYGLLFAFNLPLWLILIGLAIFLGFTFWFLSRQLISSDENFLLVLMLFLISMLEIYLALSFWLINPLTKSLILATFSYLFSGYLLNISGSDIIDKRFNIYVYSTVIVLAVLILTVSWGR